MVWFLNLLACQILWDRHQRPHDPELDEVVDYFAMKAESCLVKHYIAIPMKSVYFFITSSCAVIVHISLIIP